MNKWIIAVACAAILSPLALVNAQVDDGSGADVGGGAGGRTRGNTRGTRGMTGTTMDPTGTYGTTSSRYSMIQYEINSPNDEWAIVGPKVAKVEEVQSAMQTSTRMTGQRTVGPRALRPGRSRPRSSGRGQRQSRPGRQWILPQRTSRAHTRRERSHPRSPSP